jgi:hypothetical protein
MQQGFGNQGFYPQPVAPKRNTGKWIASIGAAVVVAVVAVVVLTQSGKSPTPVAVSTGASSALNQPTGAPATPTDPQTTASATPSSDTDYSMGECVDLTGPDENITVTSVECSTSSSSTSSQIVGIVSDGTTGDPTADSPLCLPYKYDTDFEETGLDDGAGVLYCLTSNNGQHDLRYAEKGSCVYYTSDSGAFEVDCSNSLANYVVIAVLTDTTSHSGCDSYSDYTEYFTSATGEKPPYVDCAKHK